MNLFTALSLSLRSKKKMRTIVCKNMDSGIGNCISAKVEGSTLLFNEMIRCADSGGAGKTVKVACERHGL